MKRGRGRQPSPALFYFCIVVPTLCLYWFTGIAERTWAVILGVPVALVLLGGVCVLWSLALQRQRHAPEHVCGSCGYDLTGLPDDAPVCPECGRGLPSPP